MVTDFGMSPKLGRVYYSEGPRNSFWGMQSGQADIVHSEDTIREIDLEVKRIISEASDTVHEVISGRREVLDHMARELMEKEVMNSEQLKRILDQYKTSPQISPGTHATTAGSKPEDDTPAERAAPKSEPAEGA